MKNLLNFILFFSLLGGVYGYSQRNGVDNNKASTSDYISFLYLPNLTKNILNYDPNKVLVLTGRSCQPSEVDAGDKLVIDLAKNGIPVKRAYEISYYLSYPISGEMQHEVDIMSGLMETPKPIVFVNTLAKVNPSVEEVIAAYHSFQKAGKADLNTSSVSHSSVSQ